ncbi:MAG: bifunctional glutamate N-acetyltransferase/amino-acid acetyltransferase ArgJ [Blastocatellia bacterium]|nr:bifunctional glutamate N-acetyltransferase/amino-acid acetyltransferase ArgJ [Blastocatellia bacterium]
MGKNGNSDAYSIAAPRGFFAGVARCGLKKRGDDLAIIYTEKPAVAAAVFTQNLVQAAPVLVSREHLRFKTHHAVVVNSGGANACTGEEGMNDARRTAQLVAEYFNCDRREVLVASTGVIGVRLDMNKIECGIRQATGEISRNNGSRVAEAIMTTDTRPKRASRTVKLGNMRATIAGVAKGAGMIHPNMATLLSFITTDAAIGKPALQAALAIAANQSFNRITVDGDTSTNDMLAALANGAAENDPISQTASAEFDVFTKGLTDVCRDLAIQVARDGEGARKLITVKVRHAPTQRDAEKIAVAVATSPLVKTAIAGADANWGRILAAAGRSGAKFDIAQVEIRIGDLTVARQGMGLRFDEERALAILKRNEVILTIDLHQGEEEITEWTCDLTEGYIRINGDYRS